MISRIVAYDPTWPYDYLCTIEHDKQSQSNHGSCIRMIIDINLTHLYSTILSLFFKFYLKRFITKHKSALMKFTEKIMF